jgi:hypothetical protein
MGPGGCQPNLERAHRLLIPHECSGGRHPRPLCHCVTVRGVPRGGGQSSLDGEAE